MSWHFAARNARAEWQGHAIFLSQKLAPHRFTIVPLTLEEFGPAIATRRIDLLITNTGHYVELETAGSISRIATMRILDTLHAQRDDLLQSLGRLRGEVHASRRVHMAAH